MKKAFSLIELLISLIIISVIAAAFAPVITKKVKASLLLINGGLSGEQTPGGGEGGDGGGGEEPPPGDEKEEEPEYLDPACATGPNETCCNHLEAIYISPQTHKGYTGPAICMTKVNIGDTQHDKDYSNLYSGLKNYYASRGVQMLKPYKAKINDALCVMTNENKQSCCWQQGDTANGGTSGNNIYNKTTPSYYAGENRTVCQKDAAKLLCEEWVQSGSYKGSWRLPNTTEINAINAYIAKDTAIETQDHKNLSRWAGGNGLQFCDASANVTSEIVSKKANPHYHSADKCPSVNTCRLVAGTGNNCNPSFIWSDSDPWRFANGTFTKQKYSNNMTAGVRCVTTHPGQRLKDPFNHKAEGKEPASQADCDQYGALFISAKFTGGKNICMLQTSVEPESDGGSYTFDFSESGVVQLRDGAKCTAKDNTCCWSGATGTHGGNMQYQGASRGVCQYLAAEKLCASYKPTPTDSTKYGTGVWRLPTKEELGSMALYLMASSEISPFISKYLDAGSTGGVQLCDASTSSFGSNQCKNIKKCPGAASEGTCQPGMIWTATPNGTNVHFAYQLTNGIFKLISDRNNSAALSVRCVTSDLSGAVDNYTPAADEPKSQEDCDPFGAIFLPHKYTKGKGLCMAGYNLNDYSEEERNVDFHAAKVRLVPGKQNCPSSEGGMCCWEGGNNANWKTNSNHLAGVGGGSYTGLSRTLCQRKAAEAMCANWRPISSSDGKAYSGWRLPKESELDNLANAFKSGGVNDPGFVKYSGDSGLQFCDSNTNLAGVHRCAASSFCSGASACGTSGGDDPVSYTSCPYRIWSQTVPYNFSNGLFTKQTNSSYNGENTAAGVRCVLDKLSPAYPTIKNETECNDGEIFIDKKYIGTTRDLCMKQRNFGDDSDLAGYYLGDATLDITDETIINNYKNKGVTLAFQGKNCDADAAAAKKCCWYGATIPDTSFKQYKSSSHLGVGTDGSYLNKRTMCQYIAAKALCSAYGAGWRLLKETEMQNLAITIKAEGLKSIFLSRYVGSNGLELCDNTSKDFGYGTSYCANSTKCLKATSNICMPSLIWIEDKANTGYQQSKSVFSAFTANAQAGSVRCVKEIN